MYKDVHVHETTKLSTQSTGCMICEFLVGELLYQLNENRTSAEFFPWLEEKICNKMFLKTGTERMVTSYCEKILDIILRLLVAVVENDVQPVTVCTQLTLCTSVTKASSMVS